MSTITITIDETVLNVAEQYAVAHHTTIEQLVHNYLIQLTKLDKFAPSAPVSQLKSEVESRHDILLSLPAIVTSNFKFKEESDSSVNTLEAAEAAVDDPPPTLSVLQVERKIAEMFTQMFDKKRGHEN